MKYVIATSLLISTLTGCSIIGQLTQRNSPTIEAFSVTPEEGASPLGALFEWRVSDLDGDTLMCTLDYGDSSSNGSSIERLDNCDEVTVAFHVYQEPGNYVVTLTADDGSDKVRRTAALIVDDKPASDEDFAILSFSADPNRGQAPLLTALNWTLQADDKVTCSLTFDDGSDEEVIEGCQDVTDAVHTFDEPGGYRVVLEAKRGDTTLRRSLIVVVESKG